MAQKLLTWHVLSLYKVTVPCFSPECLWKHLNNHKCFQHEEYTKEFFDTHNVVVYDKEGFKLPIKVYQLYIPDVADRICDSFNIPRIDRKLLLHTDFRDKA